MEVEEEDEKRRERAYRLYSSSNVCLFGTQKFTAGRSSSINNSVFDLVWCSKSDISLLNPGNFTCMNVPVYQYTYTNTTAYNTRNSEVEQSTKYNIF